MKKKLANVLINSILKQKNLTDFSKVFYCFSDKFLIAKLHVYGAE